MNKGRLEAFSDGVFAIIITIMVLELKVPHEPTLHALLELGPIFISYVLSFLFVAVYWANHHHLLQAVKTINTRIIWANMGLLFSLSLVPFCTAWVGETGFGELPMALYCVDVLLAALTAWILGVSVIATPGHSEEIMKSLMKQKIKTNLSMVLNLVSIPLAFYYPYLSCFLTFVVMAMWVVPSREIERSMKKSH